MSTKPCQNPCDLKSIPSYLSFFHIHHQEAARKTKKISPLPLHPQNDYRENLLLLTDFKVHSVTYRLSLLRKLGNTSHDILASKSASNFSSPYSRIKPTKLTNYSTHSN